jgi:hypothetical protein
MSHLYQISLSLVTKCVTGDFLRLTFNDVGRGREGGGVKKCFLGLRQTALLSAEGKQVGAPTVPSAFIANSGE